MLVDTKYFTSIINQPPNKHKRQATYLEALQTLTDFQIYYGHYLWSTVTCRNCGHAYRTHHEKMTDVNIEKCCHHTPLPRLVLVAGKPGSGKSTLAKELARPENLGLPLLSRDAIKAGMVETWTFARPGVSRSEIETDALRSTLVPNSFDLFYRTMTGWLQAGVSLIAEYSFDRRSEAALKPIIENANTVLIQCECPDELSRQRFIEREQTEGKVRPDRLANMMKRIALGTDPWRQFETMALPIPMLRVNTRYGYEPGLDEVTAFCRDPTGSPGSPF